MKFNPFNHIFLTKYSPFSEVLRHDFQGKVMDTFFVLFGHIREDSVVDLGCDRDYLVNLGIVDYLSLGGLALPVMFWQYCSQEDNTFTKILFPFSALLFGISIIARTILSIVGLILSLPFVAITHVVSSFFSNNDFETALTLNVQVLLSPSDKRTTTLTLKEALDHVQEAEPRLTQHHALHSDIRELAINKLPVFMNKAYN